MATRRYLDQVIKKHLQTHKVQYFQPIGTTIGFGWKLCYVLNWRKNFVIVAHWILRGGQFGSLSHDHIYGRNEAFWYKAKGRNFMAQKPCHKTSRCFKSYYSGALWSICILIYIWTTTPLGKCYLPYNLKHMGYHWIRLDPQGPKMSRASRISGPDQRGSLRQVPGGPEPGHPQGLNFWDSFWNQSCQVWSYW